MRKITELSVNAFLNDRSFSSGNTSVELNEETELKLHGNIIAAKKGSRIMITDAGWATNTTKERLNAIPGVSIHQKDFVWYLNGEKWNGSWTVI